VLQRLVCRKGAELKHTSGRLYIQEPQSEPERVDFGEGVIPFPQQGSGFGAEAQQPDDL